MKVETWGRNGGRDRRILTLTNSFFSGPKRVSKFHQNLFMFMNNLSDRRINNLHNVRGILSLVDVIARLAVEHRMRRSAGIVHIYKTLIDVGLLSCLSCPGCLHVSLDYNIVLGMRGASG